MVSRGATAETPKLSIVGLRLQAWRRGKQGSDCDTPSFTARVVQYVMGLRPVRQKVQRLGQLWTKGQTGSKCTQERMTASTTDKPNKACRAGLCVHVSMRGTQENDYNIPSLTASEVQHGMGMCQCRQELRRLCQRWTKIGLGPSAPRTGSQFCFEFCMRLNRKPEF